MWISKGKYNKLLNRLYNLEHKTKELEDSIKNKATSIALKYATQFLYGNPIFSATSMELIPEQHSVSHGELLSLLVDHLKLEITDTTAIKSVSKLTKIKPTKKPKE